MVSRILIGTLDDNIIHGMGDQGKGTHGDRMKKTLSSRMYEVFLVILKVIRSFGSWSSSENYAWKFRYESQP